MTIACFERIERLPGCRFCANPVDLGAVEAVYVISLQDQPRRFELCVDRLHAVGLCSRTIAYRPPRDRDGQRGCWLSHAAVAEHALAAGHGNALILEDDVKFLSGWSRIAARVGAAIAELPPQWRGLYIGHWPRRCYFVGRRLLRTMSWLTHAYLANRALLEWLARSAKEQPELLDEFVAIDLALHDMVEMYALFPAMARQALHGMSFRSTRFEEVIHFLHRFPEMYHASRSRTHRREMDRLPGDGLFLRRLRYLEPARIIRASGLFDEQYYLSQNPDVASANLHALAHFIRHGAREGRRPNAWFDIRAYAAEHGAEMMEDENPLAHFILTQNSEADCGKNIGNHAASGDKLRDRI